MKVRAAPGLRVPTEDNPRRYITAAEPVDVPRSAYYLRALADGDLVPADDAEAAAVENATPQADETVTAEPVVTGKKAR
ncbi:DUF2635 domain-containing protein [Cupriavidus pauculus]|uniref:DUF2635 domain-containing protein n=1 Tax=Cupriavidus pauculus TaxID=82633 RepID=UPI003857CD7A